MTTEKWLTTTGNFPLDIQLSNGKRGKRSLEIYLLNSNLSERNIPLQIQNKEKSKPQIIPN